MNQNPQDMVIGTLLVGALFVAIGAGCTIFGTVTWRRGPITRVQMNAAVKRLKESGLVAGEVGEERHVRQLRLALAPLEVIAYRGDLWRGVGVASSGFGSFLVLVGTTAQIVVTLT